MVVLDEEEAAVVEVVDGIGCVVDVVGGDCENATPLLSEDRMAEYIFEGNPIELKMKLRPSEVKRFARGENSNSSVVVSQKPSMEESGISHTPASPRLRA